MFQCQSGDSEGAIPSPQPWRKRALSTIGFRTGASVRRDVWICLACDASRSIRTRPVIGLEEDPAASPKPISDTTAQRIGEVSQRKTPSLAGRLQGYSCMLITHTDAYVYRLFRDMTLRSDSPTESVFSETLRCRRSSEPGK